VPWGRKYNRLHTGKVFDQFAGQPIGGLIAEPQKNGLRAHHTKHQEPAKNRTIMASEGSNFRVAVLVRIVEIIDSNACHRNSPDMDQLPQTQGEPGNQGKISIYPNVSF
jgi:hypothetical protein